MATQHQAYVPFLKKKKKEEKKASIDQYKNLQIKS
jgi:hypothetical protein